MSLTTTAIIPDPPSQPARVLLVDDEPAILDGLRRQLRRGFDVSTAVGGAEALELMATSEPFAAVLSDMRMPGMDGVAFLSLARERHPDTVRMLLTGQSDMESTIAAINDGQVYRFLAKPCPGSTVEAVLRDAVDLHRRSCADRAALAALELRREADGAVPHTRAGSVARAPRTLQDRLAVIRSSTATTHAS